PVLPRVRAALEGYPAAVYPGVGRHSPLASVEAGAEAASRHRADVLVSVGGGSAIDTAKCVAVLLAAGGDWAPYTIRYGETGSEARRPLPPHTLPHIAVPTTAGSASEVMPGAGFRDVAAGRRVLFRDRRLQPRAAVLDPELAVFADAVLTAATGMTAVARCVEALYSKDRQPLSEALALQGLRLLRRGLPRAVAAPMDLAARADCQLGCLLSGVAADNAMASLVHALGHVFGGRYGLPHGVPHAMLLAPALRLLLPALAEPVPGGEALADAVAALLEALPLPRRLREAGIPAADLPAIAAAAMRDHMIAYTPRPVTEAEVLAVLDAAW
ncbi:MAG: iron-containing alcohol dehydrogenase, partial [Candidatus Rokubacteria bacterium]|nr:iron-containing alcohol dehydrogenase [Candidatus Rokubacteria bacterium]